MSKNAEVVFLDNQLQNKIDVLAKTGHKRVMEILELSAAMVRTYAIKNISTGSRSGRIYKVTKAKIAHRASAPGEWPKLRNDGLKNDGGLTNSIQVDTVNDGVTVGSRSSAPHGYWLEFGTSRMAPRPWLSRAFKEKEKDIDKGLDKLLEKFINEL